MSLVRSRAVLYSTLIAIFVVSLILSFTPAGFPYSGSIKEPRVQRHYLTHTRRTFYDADGAIKFRDIGIFIKENERNSKRTLHSILDPEKLLAKDDDRMCATEAFCGFPSYNTSNAFWVAANDPPAVAESTLTLISKLQNLNSVELSFDVIGTFLTLLFVAPEPGVVITESSVSFSQHEWTEGKTAQYLRIIIGKASIEPFSFKLKLDNSKAEATDLVKVTVVTIDSHFERTPMAEEFKALVGKFPDFTFVQTHQAEVASYAFK